MSSTTSPPILPISNTTVTTTNHHPNAACGFELVDPGRVVWVVLAWVAWPGRTGLGHIAQAVVIVYFFIFGFPIQSIFILDFVLGFFGALQVWERSVGEEEDERKMAMATVAIVETHWC